MRAPRTLLAGVFVFGAALVPRAFATDAAARAFLIGDSVEQPQDAVDIQACSGASEAEAFQEKIQKSAKRFGLTEEDSAKAVQLYVQRCSRPASGSGSRSTNEVGIEKTFDPTLSKKASDRAIKTAHALNEQRGHESLVGGVEASPQGRVGRGIDYKALNAKPGAQPYALGKRNSSVPGVELHSLGDSEVAPAPTMYERARSLVTPSAATVAQDFKTLQAKLADFEMPPDAVGLASSNAPLASFVQWVKTVPASELPEITYGIVKEGEVADYSPGLALSRGKITMNHYIRDMPPDERSAVLFHELYHHWDMKVEVLKYENVAYNLIDPAHLPEHEYDAYYMTALYWQKIKSGDSKTALSRCLDRYPTNPDDVRSTVDRILGGKK